MLFFEYYHGKGECSLDKDARNKTNELELVEDMAMWPKIVGRFFKIIDNLNNSRNTWHPSSSRAIYPGNGMALTIL